MSKFLPAGSLVKSSEFASVSALSTAVGSETVTVILDSVLTVASNISWPTNATLWDGGTGDFNISSGIVLTFPHSKGSRSWGRRRLFTGTGTVKFTGYYPDPFYPEWWGAVGDDVTDCLPAFNAMFASMQNTSVIEGGGRAGGHVDLGSTNEYFLNGELMIPVACFFEGVPNSFWYQSTVLRFPANSRGIVTRGLYTEVAQGITASATASSAIVTTSGAFFSAGDVGNLYLGVAGNTNQLAFPNGAVYVTVYTSPTQVTVSANATNTITGGSLVFGRATSDQATMMKMEGFRLQGAIGGTTGTATVSGLSLTRVTGQTYGSFDSNLKGTSITVNDYEYLINTVTSNNALTLQTPNWPCVPDGTTTVRGAGYGVPSANWAGNSIIIDGTTYTISSVDKPNYSIITTATVPATGSGYASEGFIQSLGNPGTLNTRINKFHGIQLGAMAELKTIYVFGFAGDAVHVDSTGNLTAAPGTTPNMNNSRFNRLFLYTCLGHGFYASGINSNNMMSDNLDCSNCAGWAIYDQSFLGNNYYGCHVSVCYSGSYWAELGGANTTNFMNCYAEGGTVGNKGGEFVIFFGGNQGSGRAIGNLAPELIAGYQGYFEQTPTRFIRRKGDSAAGVPSVSVATAMLNRTPSYKALMSFAASDDTASTGAGGTATNPLPVWHVIYSPNNATGWVSLNYNDPGGTDFASQMLMISGSQATGGSKQIWVPNGFFLGGLSAKCWLNGSADGKLLLQNEAKNNFGLVQYGGTSSSFPATKRNSTSLDIRLADDSDFTEVKARRYAGKVTSPAQITANQNNYNPGTGTLFRLSTNASRNITGIVAGVDGDIISLANVGSFDFVLTNQDSNSTAANRIITGSGASLTVTPDQTVILQYDGTTSRWRVFSLHPVTSGSSAPVDATYITQTANGTLTNEQALGALATGILKSTTTTGVLSIATNSDLPSPPTARVSKTANQSISHDTVTVLTFDAESWDTDTIHDNATNNNRLTCKTAGKYLVIGLIQWDYNAVGQRQLIMRNQAGGDEARVQQITSDLVHQLAIAYVNMAVNDWVELAVYQTSTLSLNILTAATTFMMTRLAS